MLISTPLKVPAAWLATKSAVEPCCDICVCNTAIPLPLLLLQDLQSKLAERDTNNKASKTKQDVTNKASDSPSSRPCSSRRFTVWGVTKAAAAVGVTAACACLRISRMRS
jgi:hypothetical protein